jgi:hypothetical protein
MNKRSLFTAIMALAASWAFTQSTGSQQTDKSQSTSGDTIVGCLSGAANTFVLTDAQGYTYELTGDTSVLKKNVGHKVRLYGYVGNTGGGAKISVQGPQRTFGVKKVKSLSHTCK